MLDIGSEQLLSLRQASRLLPSNRGGKPVSFACLLRWITHGVRGPNGDRVQLEACRLGSRWLTSREALQRFAEALTPTAADKSTANNTVRQRTRAAERAARELESMGI